MKFIKLWGVFLVLNGLWCSACFAAHWAGSWADIERHAASVTSIASDFIQEKHLPILVRPLVSKGAFYYQQPGSLRWEYQSPIKSILLMDKGEASRFLGSDDGYVEDAGQGMDAMQFVMPEITGWMSGRFNTNPLFDARLEPGDKIVLTPKSKSFARMIQKIVLILSARPGVIHAVVIYESEDAFTRIIFSNPSLNRRLPDGIFKGP